MTHGEHGGCCGGAGKTEAEKSGGCCGSGAKGGCNFVTVAAVAVAIAALAYAGMNPGGDVGYAKPKIDASKLITGEDTVVAKYNGEDVHKSDIAQTVQELGANVPPENVDKILPAFTEQYINLRLLSDAAEKEGIAKETDVQAQLAASRDQIVRAAYLRKLFDGAASEDKLKAEYKKKFEDQPMPEEVRARHILVDSEDKAKDLIKKLKEGASFDKLAAENSKDPSAKNGGDLGYFTQADMVKPFGDAAFAMAVGSISKEPVKTQFGWHVIKVEDKRKRAKPSFEESKAALEQTINQELLEAKLAELRKASKVEILIKAPEGEAAPAPAAE